MTYAGSRKRAASCCDWSDCPEQNIMGYSTSQQDVVASASLQASVECIREGVSLALPGSGTRNCIATYNTFWPLLAVRTLQKLQRLPCVAL